MQSLAEMAWRKRIGDCGKQQNDRPGACCQRNKQKMRHACQIRNDSARARRWYLGIFTDIACSRSKLSTCYSHADVMMNGYVAEEWRLKTAETRFGGAWGSLRPSSGSRFAFGQGDCGAAGPEHGGTGLMKDWLDWKTCCTYCVGVEASVFFLTAWCRRPTYVHLRTLPRFHFSPSFPTK